MAKKEEQKSGNLERVYTIPLRKKTVKVVNYKRSPKAVKVIREFLSKHMKADKIIIDKSINEQVWARGIKHPPGKVKVKAIKDEEGVVRASLEV